MFWDGNTKHSKYVNVSQINVHIQYYSHQYPSSSFSRIRPTA